MKVHLSARARRDADVIDRIWRQYAKWDPKKFVKELKAVRTRLKYAPKLGKIHSIVDGQIIRQTPLLESQCIVYYVESEDLVDIITIWNGRQGTPPTFSDE